VKKMNGRPQMILLFALHLADLMEKSLGLEPAVHVLSIASLNYRTPQFLIDPSVNLARAEAVGVDWRLGGAAGAARRDGASGVCQNGVSRATTSRRIDYTSSFNI
jgi:hypothetical protein